MIFTPKLALSGLLAVLLVACGGGGGSNSSSSESNNAVPNADSSAAFCENDITGLTDTDRDWTCAPGTLQGKVYDADNGVIQNSLNCSTRISSSGDVTLTVSGEQNLSIAVSNADARQHSYFVNHNDETQYRVWIGAASYSDNDPHISFRSPAGTSKIYVNAFPLKASDGQIYKADCVFDPAAQGATSQPVISQAEFLERYTTPVLMNDGTWAPCTNSLARDAFGIPVGTPAAFVDVNSLHFLPGAEGTITAPR